MKLAALISGGKDSLLALYKAHKLGHSVDYLLTMEPESDESYMFHHPNIWITDLISKTLNIPLIKGRTHGLKEEELKDLDLLFDRVENNVEGIITGALASTYQKTRIEKLCEKRGLEALSPLWGFSGERLWKELLEHDFRVMITSVASNGLDDEWLGKIVDKKDYLELKSLSKKYRFHLGFEGGEAETLVLDMPLYKGRINVIEAESSWTGGSGKYKINKAVLEDK